MKLVDVEDIANDKIRTHDLALEINTLTKQLSVIEQITPIQLALKNNEMMKKNEMLMLDQNLHKNRLYSTFVHLLTTEQNTMTIDTEVEVLHVTTLIIKTFHKIDTVPHLEIDFIMTKVLLLHNTQDHDMTHTNAIHCLAVLHTDLHIDPLIDKTLALDIDHALIQENITSRKIQIHTDHPLDQETLDTLDMVHIPTLDIKSTWYNHKINLNL